MKKHLLMLGIILIFMASAPGSTLAQSTSLGSTFTYQGYLTNAGGPVNGVCDLQFSLFDAPVGGNQIGSTFNQPGIPFSNGAFHVQLDFGGTAFDGSDRYLQIAIGCPAGIGVYTTLTPRQAITPTPYAASLYGLHVQPNVTSPNLIGGFSGNVILNGVTGAFVGGGGEVTFPNRITDDFSVIGGGESNQAGNNTGTTSDAEFATVAGGTGNKAIATSTTVGGGASNLASFDRATVSGGLGNTASSTASTVGGGQSNTASGYGGAISGGQANTASGNFSTVGGGFTNTASGQYATIPGGANNFATGAYSFAAGFHAYASNDGTFTWADSTGANFGSNIDNIFLARASGGFYLYTNPGSTTGVQLPSGSGAWSSLSDRNMKANFARVDPQTVLQGVVNLPLTTWNYNAQDASIRHIGPMAQDFYASFGVGEDNTHISTIDSEGVALAAIQGLYQQVQAKDAEISDLQTRLDEVQVQLSALQNGQPLQTGGVPVWLLTGLIFMAGIQVVVGTVIIFNRKAK